MKQRLPFALSATALVVALFGSTPLGGAAGRVLANVPPFAKKAGYATNAGAVNGIKASKTAKPGYLVPLGADGKFPASVGQAGQKGDAGSKGDAGPQGAKGDAGPKGDKGDAGAQGTALAYAEVVGTSVVAVNSRNVAQSNLTNPSPGIFCFNGLSFTPHNMVASFGSLGGAIQTRLSDGLTSACSGMQAEVITTNSGGSFANVDFTVMMN